MEEARITRIRSALASGLAVCLVVCSSCGERPRSQLSVPVYGYQVVREIPHDRQAFTQGFAISGMYFFESTGLYGRSSIRVLDARTGEILKNISLEPRYFGEGLTVHGNRVIQLTWRERTGFVYDSETLELLMRFSFEGEGWGLATDGRRLIMSDGSANLRFLDLVSFQETGRLSVLDGNKPVTGLNELEYVKGLIYANIWLTERIAMIDPTTGVVRGWIDLRGLAKNFEGPHDVLNGIAYDPREDRLFVTGKFWPRIFEIQLRQLR